MHQKQFIHLSDEENTLDSMLKIYFGSDHSDDEIIPPTIYKYITFTCLVSSEAATCLLELRMK